MTTFRREAKTVEIPAETGAQLMAADARLVRIWVPSWAALGLSAMQAVRVARECQSIADKDAATGAERRHWTQVIGEVRRRLYSIFPEGRLEARTSS